MLRNPNYVYGDEPLSVPPHLNCAKYMVETLWSYKDKVALINGSSHEKITYRELVNGIMNLALSLTRMSVKKGDTIAICSENRQEYFSTLIGILCTGAVVTATNAGSTIGELKHNLGISKPTIIFCSPIAYKNYAKTLETLAYIKKVILFGNEKPNGTLLYEELVRAKTGETITLETFEVVDVLGQIDTAIILYSSGTTGLPKGVMLTHLNVLTVCKLSSSLDPNNISLYITPWYHTMGMMGTLRNFCTGGTIVYLPKFDANFYMQTIEKYKIQQIIVAPPVLVAVCKCQANYDVSSISIIYSGAAPLKKDTIRAVRERFPNLVAVLQGYGMTESTLAVTRDTYLDVPNTKVGGVGRVLSCNIIKVFEDIIANLKS